VWSRCPIKGSLVTPEPCKRLRRSYLRFKADLPNECWQSAFTRYPLANETDTEIISWLDDHARYALHCTVHTRITGTTVLDTFAHATNQHGIPAHTLTDNGLVFTTISSEDPMLSNVTLQSLESGKETGALTTLKPREKLSDSNKLSKNGSAPKPTPTRLKNSKTNSMSSARAKATPDANNDGHWRIRYDKVDKAGHVTLRHASA